MIPTTMKAIRAYGPLDYRIETVPVPVPAEGEYLARVMGVGICASDVKMYLGSEFFWGPGGRVRSRPVIPGHEFACLLVAAGPNTEMPAERRVVAEQLVTCHHCWFCNRRELNKCDNLCIYGQALNGAMAEYMIVAKTSFIHTIPEGLSWHQAVLAEPLAVSVHGVERASLTDDDQVLLVSGCGSIGLGVIAAIKHYYPDKIIIACDPNAFKTDIAIKLGASYGVTPSGIKQLVQNTPEIPDLLAKGGPDVYFECSGNPESILTGLASVRKRGKIVHIGISKEEAIPTNWNICSAGKELNVIGVSLGVDCWDKAFEILQKGVLAEAVTHVVGLSSYRSAFAKVQNPVDCIKIIIDPNLASDSSNENDDAVCIECAPKEVKVAPLPVDMSEPHYTSFSLQGAVTLVTGSSRGIGKRVAETLSQHGAVVVFHGTSPSSTTTFGEDTLTLAQLADRVSSQSGNQTMAVWGDLTDPVAVERIFFEIKERYRRIDCLVCCAGGNIGNSGVDTASGGKPALDSCTKISVDDIRSVLDRNLMTAVLSCRQFCPEMQQRRYGRVIILGSVAGSIGRADGAMYAVAKAAVHSYSRCLAAEMRPFGISVNCVAPGATLTERFQRNLASNKDEARASLPSHSLERYGDVQDTANLVAMLCSDSCQYISGQVIEVDGGGHLGFC